MAHTTLALVVVLGAACGSVDSEGADGGTGGDVDAPPVIDMAGVYSLTVTNGANGCQVVDWIVGQSTANLPLTVTQDGEMVFGEIGGVLGTWVETVVGSRTFIGTISGSAFQMTLVGERDVTEEMCTYRVRATVDGTSDGDLISGTIEYTKVIDASQPCAALDGCITSQTFNGTRPP